MITPPGEGQLSHPQIHHVAQDWRCKRGVVCCTRRFAKTTTPLRWPMWSPRAVESSASRLVMIGNCIPQLLQQKNRFKDLGFKKYAGATRGLEPKYLPSHEVLYPTNLFRLEMPRCAYAQIIPTSCGNDIGLKLTPLAFQRRIAHLLGQPNTPVRLASKVL